MTTQCKNCKTLNPATAQICTGCGQLLAPAAGPLGTSPLAPGAVLDGRYEVIAKLHESNMSFVYLANDRRFQSARCVVKQMISPFGGARIL